MKTESSRSKKTSREPYINRHTAHLHHVHVYTCIISHRDKANASNVHDVTKDIYLHRTYMYMYVSVITHGHDLSSCVGV